MRSNGFRPGDLFSPRGMVKIFLYKFEVFDKNGKHIDIEIEIDEQFNYPE